jgi:uncharacterized protein YbjT (DUF2867 family)
MAGLRVAVFGATGMVGRGVLRECLQDDGVDGVLTIGRSPVGVSDRKLHDVVVKDLYDVDSYAAELDGYSACFFCLGVSSAGMSEDAYSRITYDLTLGVARALAGRDPRVSFVYVSGQGTDADGRAMWARVKGRTENDILALDLDAYMMRPGFIRPVHGERPRTAWYRVAYTVLRPVFALLPRIAPGSSTSTVAVGRTMLKLARDGAAERLLDNGAINRLGA